MLIFTQPCSLIEFYDAIATEMGYDNINDLEYDCRKINIAANIQDNFYSYYTDVAKRNDKTLSDNDIKVGTTILLAMSGPKVDETLKVNEVEIFEGFICHNTKLML